MKTRAGMCGYRHTMSTMPPHGWKKPNPTVRECSIDGCHSRAESRGWCPKHYVRWKVTGDPSKTKPVGRRKKVPTPCVVENCDMLERSRGLCSRHYQRLLYHGSVETCLNGRGTPRSELFLAKVEVVGECWRWTGVVTPRGYGMFRDGKMRSAHRWAYESFIGPIPNGLQLDHLCHTDDHSCLGGDECPHRRCVNPAHLEPVTARGNSLRGTRRSREYQ